MGVTKARIEEHLQKVRSCTSQDLASEESIRGSRILRELILNATAAVSGQEEVMISSPATDPHPRAVVDDSDYIYLE